MIELVAVDFAYGRARSLRDLIRGRQRPDSEHVVRGMDLQIADGERLGILGANGVGKTTVLKLAGGLLYPRGGRVLVRGLDTVRAGLRLRSTIGYVINEDRSFYWPLTGGENLEFFAALNDVHGAAAARRIAAVMEDVGLESARNVRVGEYSSGMRQRLAIARALLHLPSILLLDEPTRCLDPERAAAIRDFLVRWATARRDRMLVVTTHDESDVAVMCTRTLRLGLGARARTPVAGAPDGLAGGESAASRTTRVETTLATWPPESSC